MIIAARARAFSRSFGLRIRIAVIRTTTMIVARMTDMPIPATPA